MPPPPSVPNRSCGRTTLAAALAAPSSKTARSSSAPLRSFARSPACRIRSSAPFPLWPSNWQDRRRLSTPIRPTPLDPIAVKLFSLYPHPNTGTPGATANNFLFDPNKIQFSTTVDGRIDHRFNDSNLLYGRYTLNRVNTTIPNNLPAVSVGGALVSPGSGPFGFSGPANDVAHNFQLNYTHVFTPTLLLELKTA